MSVSIPSTFDAEALSLLAQPAMAWSSSFHALNVGRRRFPGDAQEVTEGPSRSASERREVCSNVTLRFRIIAVPSDEMAEAEAAASRVVPTDILSNREHQVINLVSAGWTNREIGHSMGLSVHAVKFHLASIYRKLGVANRTEAAVVFMTASADAANPDDLDTR